MLWGEQQGLLAGAQTHSARTHNFVGWCCPAHVGCCTAVSVLREGVTFTVQGLLMLMLCPVCWLPEVPG